VITILRFNFYFLLPYLAFLVLGAFLLLLDSKVDIHLIFNSFHSSFFDSFFSYITYLGDGVTALLVTIMLLAVKYRYVLIVGLSNIIASIVTQTLKQTIFSEALRPKKYFEGLHDLYFVPGVKNFLYYSFPSGHTTCAFALYFSLCLIVKSNTLKFLFFIIALLVAYSRVYLSQHFFEDIYAGSLIGVIVTLIVFRVVQKNDSEKLEHSLITLF
jgi:membrane-associated phospholipid phosphatase